VTESSIALPCPRARGPAEARSDAPHLTGTNREGLFLAKRLKSAPPPSARTAVRGARGSRRTREFSCLPRRGGERDERLSGHRVRGPRGVAWGDKVHRLQPLSTPVRTGARTASAASARHRHPRAHHRGRLSRRSTRFEWSDGTPAKSGPLGSEGRAPTKPLRSRSSQESPLVAGRRRNPCQHSRRALRLAPEVKTRPHRDLTRLHARSQAPPAPGTAGTWQATHARSLPG
jgi:hypothetical protein